MNTRILRMIDRRPIAAARGQWKLRSWRIAGVGYLQPTLLAIESERGITLRIEGAVGNRCVWHVLPLATSRTLAKAHLALLEWHKARGTAGPAQAAWQAGKAAGVYR